MSETNKKIEEGMNDHLEDLICDVSEENFGRTNLYDCLKSDFEQQLYRRCRNFTRLLTVRIDG